MLLLNTENWLSEISRARQQKRKENRMIIVPIVIVWLVAVIGIFIMKKTEPDIYKVYKIYALLVAMIFTLFLIGYVLILDKGVT